MITDYWVGLPDSQYKKANMSNLQYKNDNMPNFCFLPRTHLSPCKNMVQVLSYGWQRQATSNVKIQMSPRPLLWFLPLFQCLKLIAER